MRSSKKKLEAEVEAARKVPLFVVQPLPRDRGTALTWLFFTHMPPRFRHLSRASFLAQQMLLPRPCGEEVAATVQVGGLPLASCASCGLGLLGPAGALS